MRGSLLIDLLLGFATAFFQSQNDDRALDYIKRVTAVKAAGGNIDAHMRQVADYLNGDGELDFTGLGDRIDAEVDELLERGGGFEPPPQPGDPDFIGPVQPADEDTDPVKLGGGGGGGEPPTEQK